MRKVAALVAVVTLGVGTLTACSGGDYCAELKGYVESAKGLDPKNKEAADKMLNEAKKVSKAAPDDLKDDWKTVMDYAEKAKEADGDQAKLTELAKNDGQKITTAFEAIGRHANETCKVDLSPKP